MQFSRYVAAPAFVVLTAGAALATPNTLHRMHNAMAARTLNINMGAQNGSRQYGTASLRQMAGGVQVRVSIMNEPRGASEPAHIHAGTCRRLNPQPYRPLHNVVNGTSTTMVGGVSVAQLKARHYAINVHDEHKLARYVSCGDI